MEFKSMEKWRVLQKFNMSEKQYKRLVKRLKRRHPNERWIDEHFAQNGERVVYLKLEFVEWIEEVYFNNNLFYLDAEINFFRKQILRLEGELNFPHNEFEYNDISLYDLRNYFNKSKNAIGVAVNRMVKRINQSFKYLKDGKVIIFKEGVKWLSENYFRKNYLKKLEFYKLELQNVKRNRNGLKDIIFSITRLV